MIAYCGLNCLNCDAFIASKENSDELRKKTAEKWSIQFNVDIDPKTINCTGCKSDGIRFFYCDNSCTIRKCCIKKQITSCIDCADFPCEDINFILNNAPETKENLEKLRK